MKEIFWEDIYRAESPRLLAICRRYVKDTHKAEDLMHDAFLTAIQRQEGYAGIGAFQGWLRAITVNTVLQYLRKEKYLSILLQTDFPDEYEESLETSENPRDLLLEAGFEHSDLLEALDLLPNHHKIVFNLYVFEDYSHLQIAEALDISPGTSKSHLARARKKIQEILLKKILNMKKKKKRAAIFILPIKENNAYIDKIFKSSLSEHAIQPTPEIPEILSDAFKCTPTIPVVGNTILLIPPSYIYFIITSALCIGLFMASNLRDKPENRQTQILPSKPASPIITQQSIHTPAQQGEENVNTKVTNPESRKASVTRLSQSEPIQTTLRPAKKEEVPPIIMNKKLIIKDTVYQTIDRNEN